MLVQILPDSARRVTTLRIRCDVVVMGRGNEMIAYFNGAARGPSPPHGGAHMHREHHNILLPNYEQLWRR